MRKTQHAFPLRVYSILFVSLLVALAMAVHVRADHLRIKAQPVVGIGHVTLYCAIMFYDSDNGGQRACLTWNEQGILVYDEALPVERAATLLWETIRRGFRRGFGDPQARLVFHDFWLVLDWSGRDGLPLLCETNTPIAPGAQSLLCALGCSGCGGQV